MMVQQTAICLDILMNLLSFKWHTYKLTLNSLRVYQYQKMHLTLNIDTITSISLI